MSTTLEKPKKSSKLLKFDKVVSEFPNFSEEEIRELITNSSIGEISVLIPSIFFDKIEISTSNLSTLLANGNKSLTYITCADSQKNLYFSGKYYFIDSENNDIEKYIKTVSDIFKIKVTIKIDTKKEYRLSTRIGDYNIPKLEKDKKIKYYTFGNKKQINYIHKYISFMFFRYAIAYPNNARSYLFAKFLNVCIDEYIIKPKRKNKMIELFILITRIINNFTNISTTYRHFTTISSGGGISNYYKSKLNLFTTKHRCSIHDVCNSFLKKESIKRYLNNYEFNLIGEFNDYKYEKYFIKSDHYKKVISKLGIKSKNENSIKIQIINKYLLKFINQNGITETLIKKD